MKNAKQNFFIIAITIAAVGALAMAGIFAAILRAAMLPFILASKKSKNPYRKTNPNKPAT